MPDEEAAVAINHANLRGVMKLDSGRGLCTVCGKDFFDLQKAKRHFLALHVRQRKGNCPVCQTEFKSQAALLAHMKSKHGISKKELEGKGKIIKMEEEE